MVWNHVCVFFKIFEIQYLPWKVTWVVWYYWNVQSTRLSSTGVDLEPLRIVRVQTFAKPQKKRPKRNCSSSKHQFQVCLLLVSGRVVHEFDDLFHLWFDFVVSFGSGAMTSIFYIAIKWNLSLLQTFANQPSMAEQPYTLAWSYSVYMAILC